MNFEIPGQRNPYACSMVTLFPNMGSGVSTNTKLSDKDFELQEN